VIYCDCRYCAQSVERRAQLRRRNPDDLERLEKIAEATSIYRETRHIGETAKQMGVHRVTIRRWLKEIIKEEDPRAEQARKLYETKKNFNEIARQLKAHPAVVRKWIGSLAVKKEKVDPRREEARRFFLETGDVRATAKKVGVSWPTAKKWTLDLEWQDPKIAQTRKIFKETLNISETARQVGVGRPQVRKWVDDLWDLRSKKKLAKIKQAKKLYAETGNVSLISRELEVDDSTIMTWLGLVPKKKDYERLKKEAVEIYFATGMIKDVMDQTGVSWRLAKKLVSDVHYVDPRKEKARKLYIKVKSISKVMKIVNASYATTRGWVSDLIPYKELSLEKLELIEEARSLYKETKSINETAKRMGLSPVKIRVWVADLLEMKKQGQLRRRNPDDLETLERMAKAIALFNEGYSTGAIAKKLKVDWQTINNWVKHLEAPQIENHDWHKELLFLHSLPEANYKVIGDKVGRNKITVAGWARGVLKRGKRIFYTPSVEDRRKIHRLYLEAKEAGLEPLVEHDWKTELAFVLATPKMGVRKLAKQIKIGDVTTITSWATGKKRKGKRLTPNLNQQHKLHQLYLELKQRGVTSIDAVEGWKQELEFLLSLPGFSPRAVDKLLGKRYNATSSYLGKQRGVKKAVAPNNRTQQKIHRLYLKTVDQGLQPISFVGQAKALYSYYGTYLALGVALGVQRSVASKWVLGQIKSPTQATIEKVGALYLKHFSSVDQ